MAASALTEDVLEKVVSELVSLAPMEQALNYVFDRDPVKRREQFKMTLKVAVQDHNTLEPRGDVNPAEGLGWQCYVQCMGTALMRAGVASYAREHIFGALQKMEGLVELPEPEAPLDTQRVAFSALRSTMQDSSSATMQHVKQTLQQATEITAKVDEAERVAEEALRFASAISAEHSHLERQRASRKHLYRFRQSRGSARAQERLGEELSQVPAPIAASLTKEIQLSVLWTQQLLSLVELAESHEVVQLGAKLHPQGVGVK